MDEVSHTAQSLSIMSDDIHELVDQFRLELTDDANLDNADLDATIDDTVDGIDEADIEDATVDDTSIGND